MINKLAKSTTGNSKASESDQDKSFVIKFQGRAPATPHPQIKNAQNFNSVKIYLKDGHETYGKYAASVTLSAPEFRLALGIVLNKNWMVKGGALPFLCENDGSVMGIEMESHDPSQKKFQRITNGMLQSALQYYANELAADIKAGAKDEYNISWDDWREALAEQTQQQAKQPRAKLAFNLPKLTDADLIKMAEIQNKIGLSMAQGGKVIKDAETEAFDRARVLLGQILASKIVKDAPANAQVATEHVIEFFNRFTPEQKKATISALMAVHAMANILSEQTKTNNPATQNTPAVSTTQTNAHFKDQQKPKLLADNEIPIAPTGKPHTEGSDWKFAYNEFNEPEKAFRITAGSARPDWRGQNNAAIPTAGTERTVPGRTRVDTPSSQFKNASSEAKPSYFYLNVEEAKILAERLTGMPIDLADAIMQIESKNNPNALNNDNGSYKGTFACGLYQLMPVGPNTYQEMLWKYGDMMGLNEIFGVESVRNTVVLENQVIGHKRDGSEIIGNMFTDGYKEKAMEYCSNPTVNNVLGAMHMIDKMKRTEALLIEKYGKGFESVPYEIFYLNHFLGSRPDLIHAYFNEPTKLAKDFVTPAIVRGNRGMFIDRDGNARTVEGMFEHMRTKGNMHGKIITDPREFFWQQPIEEIAARAISILKEADKVTISNDNLVIASGGNADVKRIVLAP